MNFFLDNWVSLVSLFISLLTAVIAGLTFYRVFLQEKQNLSINIDNTYYLQAGDKVDMYVSFSNLSKLPIAITQININYRNHIILKDIGVAERVYTRGDVGNYKSIVYSNSLPINLQPYSSFKDLIRFDLSNSVDSNQLKRILKEDENIVNVEVITTRNNLNIELPIKQIQQVNDIWAFYKKFDHHKKVSNQHML